jgi:trimethylamine:corrinoid methyltransferase-like protein
MTFTAQAVPHFSLFTREQCETVHYASLEILRRTGVRVDHPWALALLKETAAVITDGNLVRFPPALVEWALAGAPSRTTLCKRGSSEVAIRMQGREVAFGSGGMALDREAFALDLIHEIGPGGSYLTTQHTLQHFRDFWQPALYSRLRMNDWVKRGSKRLGDRLREKTVALIDRARTPELPAQVLAEIEYIRK